MKTLLTLSLILLHSLSFAADVELTFEWDPNTEPDLAGYRLYMGDSSRKYSSIISETGKVTRTTVTIQMDFNSIKYFALTAFDTEGNESGYSNEVNYFLSVTGPGVPPRAPTLRLKEAVVF